ncbi:MAG: hypothetical protein PHS92_05635 [Candidatus Gracilibacteria bacterium]|nr:hypothetical protein [Candidatus Gracilibacteria bacterium]
MNKADEKNEVLQLSFIEKEMLHNSIVQKELLKTIRELNETIQENTCVLKNIEKHEFLSIHKSKWKIVLYNLTLGILFALGTVLGLFLLSWLTYNFFKDSIVLKNIVDNQLNMRQFNLQDIKERVNSDIKK